MNANKKLPPLPAGDGHDPTEAPEPLIIRRKRQPGWSATAKERNAANDVHRQNALLQAVVRKKDDEIMALKQQVVKQRQYIHEQNMGLAEAMRTTCLAFERYRETATEATRRVGLSEDDDDTETINLDGTYYLK